MRKVWVFLTNILLTVPLMLFGVRDYSPLYGGTDAYTKARHQMVESQIRRRGILNFDVLRILRNVPRHEFVPLHYLLLDVLMPRMHKI